MSDEQRDKALEMMRDGRICMMVTRSDDGDLHSRPMAVQRIDDDQTIWFLVDRRSDKVAEIGADARVNLAFSDDGSWVSAAGTARVVEDQASKSDMWNPMVEAWFPDGENDPEIVCMAVEPSSAEYWDGPGGLFGTLISLVKSKVTGTRLEADNESVELDGR